MKQPNRYVIHAAAVRDAAGVNARPGAVLVINGRVAYAGDPAGLDPRACNHAEAVDLHDKLLLPAMVNAHTHLQLTDIGPRPYDLAGGFVGWVKALRSIEWEHLPAEQVVAEAARLCLDAGVGAVGDIADSAGCAQASASAGLAGVTYLELFGLGPPHDQSALDTIASTPIALQPHAPYSAGPALYAAAVETGRPLCTHLAETPDEARFVARGDGPWRDYLQAIGRWDPAFARQYGQGLSPVQWMRPHLEQAADHGGWLVAHCNHVDDDDIHLLADTSTSVAYCPIASEYFGHRGHRYRDMLDAGVNVCLGTDSIVCARPDDPQPLGVLGAMRLLYQRDRTSPDTLLKMATVNGANALRMLARKATLSNKAPARFACIAIDPDNPVDPLAQTLESDAPASMLDLATLDQAWFKGFSDE